MVTYAVRQGDWKLVYNSPFAPLEMYNLKTDPLEEHDLLKEGKRPPQAQAMFKLLGEIIQRAGSVPWQKP
jgi:arylsulfatase A-like enzyme